LDLDGVLKIQDWIWIAKYDSPLISGMESESKILDSVHSRYIRSIVVIQRLCSVVRTPLSTRYMTGKWLISRLVSLCDIVTWQQRTERMISFRILSSVCPCFFQNLFLLLLLGPLGSCENFQLR